MTPEERIGILVGGSCEHTEPFNGGICRECVVELIEAEREACAKIADAWFEKTTAAAFGVQIGNAIRARSKTPEPIEAKPTMSP